MIYTRVFRTRLKYCIAWRTSRKIRTCTNMANETHSYITLQVILLMPAGSNVTVLQHFRYSCLKKHPKEYHQYLHTFHIIDGQYSLLFQSPSVCRLPRLRTCKHSTSSRNSRSQFIFDVNGNRSSSPLLSNIYVGQSVWRINHIPLRRTSQKWYRRIASTKLKIHPIQVIINISTPHFCTRPCRSYRTYILMLPKQAQSNDVYPPHRRASFGLSFSP